MDFKQIAITALVAILVSFGVLAISGGKTVNVGSSPVVHNTSESFDAGIDVNQTEVINSSGVWVGAVSGTSLVGTSLTSLNGTATSTIQAGSSVIGTKAGKLCLWNGTNFSILSFASNSTSTSIATSTTCQ